MAKKGLIIWRDALSELNAIPFPFYKNKIEDFEKILQEQFLEVTRNLAKSGVTVAQRTLREATTEWGKARMRGEAYGVRFAPYGRSAGREKTGFMYDSLSWDVELTGGGSKNQWRGIYGWPVSAIQQSLTPDGQSYIKLQEKGFYNTGKFDPAATAASGRAKFKEGAARWTRGAGSLDAAARSIANRSASAWSAAWNEAARQWYASGNTQSVGTYVQGRARARFGRFR